MPATPYRGIQPFRYADHAIFFAREEESRRLASLVDVYRGVFLYGGSGNGKSSLVNAGLLPQARPLGFEPVRVRVQPRAGEELVIEQLAVSDDGTDVLPCVLAPEHAGSSRVVLSIAEFEARVHAASQEHQPLIVFDQFEEILTLFESEEAAASRRALTEMIVALLRGPLPVKLLFAFREDYLGRVKQLLGARPELVDQALRLGPPSADALNTIIGGPFDRFPGRFERELDDALAERLRAALAERFGSGEVSLSEVQTVCLRLWQSPDPEALLVDKGVQGLLEDELGEALDAFAPDVRAAAIALLSQMVTSAGTRNVVSAEDLRERVREEDGLIAPALLDQALDRLERESKLVRRERRRDLYLYEITSEFLVPWISRQREQLRLLQERRREHRRLRILASIAGSLLIVAALVAAIAVWALDQRADARRQASDARSLALAASSVGPLTTRPDVSLALAFEAYRESPRLEAGSAVIRALRTARESGLRGVLTADEILFELAFSPDGKLLAVAGDDGVRLWDPALRTRLGRLAAPAGAAKGVAFSHDGQMLASTADDGAVRLWNPTTRKPLGSLSGHTGPTTDVAFSPNGQILASAGEDKTVRLWNPATRKQVGRLTGHDDAVAAVAFSPGGQILASAGGDGTIRLWNPATRKQLARLRGHVGPVKALAFSPDGKTLASTGDDSTVRLWNAATGKQLARLPGHEGAVNAVAFGPGGKILASASTDATVRLWNPATGKQLARLTGHYGWVSGIAFSPDGQTLASASEEKTIRLWNPATRKQSDLLTGHDDTVYDLAFSPTGKALASAGFDGMVRLWNPGARKEIAPPAVHDGPVFGVAFSPDGQMLASASVGGIVRVWRPVTGERLELPSGHSGTVYDVAFSPDGQVLASAGDDTTIRLWNPVDRKQLGRLSGHRGPVKAVAFSPDGKTLVSAGDDKTVRLWNPAARKQLGRLSGHRGRVNAVAFSPDGKTIATASDDKTVRLWNLATRKPLSRLAGHNGPVNAVMFRADGKMLVSGSDDMTVRLWNPASRKQVARLTGHRGPVRTVAFSPDGKTLVSGSHDMTVRLWNETLSHSVRHLRATVCDVLLAGLSRPEWALHAAGIPYRRSCP